MKKYVLLFTVIMSLFATKGQAQLKILYGDAELGDTLKIDIKDLAAGDQGTYYLNFRNDGGQENLDVTLTQTTVSISENATIEWCGPGGTGACYGEDLESDFFTLVGNTVSDDTKFYVKYKTDDKFTPATVRYTLKNAENASDSASVVILFRSTLSTQTVAKSEINIDVYPNPANTNLGIRYAFPKAQKNASFIVRNMVGAIVKEVALTEAQGKVNLKVDELANGIYFYSLLVNGQAITTKKLIIKH